MVIEDDSVKEDGANDRKAEGFQLLLDSILKNLRITLSGSQSLDVSAFDKLANVEKATFEML